MTHEPTPAELRRQLERWFQAAVTAVEPVAATSRALDRAPVPDTHPAVFAFGKAAHGMACAAVQWLDAHRLPPAGGLVVAHEEPPPGRMPLEVLVGDHPVPGERSRAAADRLGEVIAALPDGAPAMVFLSGGASSLLAAPLDGITDDALGIAFEVFHDLGLPIHVMNALRRQLTRWSGGRLAVALGSREVRAWVISDVVDNDLAVIGSGPLVGGAINTDLLSRVLSRPDLVARLPASVTAALAAAAPPERGTIPHHIVADRNTAAAAAVRAAQADGMKARYHERPLTGEVETAAVELAGWLADHVERRTFRPPPGIEIDFVRLPPEQCLHVWTGETTVELPVGHGTGGRAQQFALVIARELVRLEQQGANVHGISVLAAGTDGRDGPTDAAGAIVDRETASRIAVAGWDLDRAIARCDAYPALEAAGALLHTGATGTNVADVVLVSGWDWA